MRRCLASTVFALVLIACSSFTSDPGTNASAADGGTEGSLGSDAASTVPTDGPSTDGSADGDTGATDAGDPRCTLFDSDPRTLPGWAVQGPDVGSSSLTTVSQGGRVAVRAHVEAANGRAALVHDVHPGPGGAVTVIVDLQAVTMAGFSGSLVELVVLSCVTPAQKVALEVDPAGELLVEASPTMSASTATFGAPAPGWHTLTLTVSLTSVTVNLDGVVKSATMGTSFAAGVGCTLAVGAKATGNIGVDETYYARACIE